MYWLTKLKEFKDEQKATYKSISAQTGIALTTIEKLFSGRTKEPKLLMIDNIVRSLGHSLSELVEAPPENILLTKSEKDFISRFNALDDKGKQHILTELTAEEERMAFENAPTLYHKVYYDIPVSAGTGEFLDYSTVAIAELTQMPPHGTDYILRIAGDSMEPEFANGDYVYVKRTDVLDYYDIGIFTLGGNVYIKEYTPRGLRSFNKKYRLIDGNSEIKCLGKVLGKLSGDITVC